MQSNLFYVIDKNVISKNIEKAAGLTPCGFYDIIFEDKKRMVKKEKNSS